MITSLGIIFAVFMCLLISYYLLGKAVDYIIHRVRRRGVIKDLASPKKKKRLRERVARWLVKKFLPGYHLLNDAQFHKRLHRGCSKDRRGVDVKELVDDVQVPR